MQRQYLKRTIIIICRILQKLKPVSLMSQGTQSKTRYSSVLLIPDLL